jgi:beta-1,4-N-acetylglucosaminyltransferase
MLAFVTVGSTRFDSLVQSILSSQILSCLLLKGYSELVIQCGLSEVSDLEMPTESGIPLKLHKDGVAIEIWRFKSSLETEYDRADLVISHAGLICFFSISNARLRVGQVRELYLMCCECASLS